MIPLQIRPINAKIVLLWKYSIDSIRKGTGLEEEELEKVDYGQIPIETPLKLDENIHLARLAGRSTDDSFCPLCSKVLTDPEARRCPHCGADIEQARKAVKLSRDIIAGIERAFRQGDFEAAEEGLKNLDQINLGELPRGTFLRAKLLFYRKNLAQAIAMANGVLEKLDEDDELRDEIKSALPDWQAELRRKLESQEHYNFALSRIRGGYFEEAYDHLLKAIKLAPYLPENFRLLGKVCLKLRDYENGRYYLERAILLDAYDQPALDLLARLERAEKLEMLKVAKRRFYLGLALFFSSVVFISLIFAIFFVFPNLFT